MTRAEAYFVKAKAMRARELLVDVHVSLDTSLGIEGLLSARRRLRLIDDELRALRDAADAEIVEGPDRPPSDAEQACPVCDGDIANCPGCGGTGRVPA